MESGRGRRARRRGGRLRGLRRRHQGRVRLSGHAVHRGLRARRAADPRRERRAQGALGRQREGRLRAGPRGELRRVPDTRDHEARGAQRGHGRLRELGAHRGAGRLRAAGGRRPRHAQQPERAGQPLPGRLRPYPVSRARDRAGGLRLHAGCLWPVRAPEAARDAAAGHATGALPRERGAPRPGSGVERRIAPSIGGPRLGPGAGQCPGPVPEAQAEARAAPGRDRSL